MATPDPEILNPDKTRELQREIDAEGPDRPGRGGRVDGRRISLARWYYASDPQATVKGVCDRVGIDPQIGYRHKDDWDEWREYYVEIKKKHTGERYLKNLLARIRWNALAIAKIGEATEAVDIDKPDAADQLGKLARAEAANTNTFQLLHDRPTARVESTAPVDRNKSAAELREEAQQMLEELQRRLSRDGGDA